MAGSEPGDPPAALRAFSALAKVFSPYELNPFEINPLRRIVNDLFDFERLRAGAPVEVFC